jgi:hypothetical protein
MNGDARSLSQDARGSCTCRHRYHTMNGMESALCQAVYNAASHSDEPMSRSAKHIAATCQGE